MSALDEITSSLGIDIGEDATRMTYALVPLTTVEIGVGKTTQTIAGGAAARFIAVVWVAEIVDTVLSTDAITALQNALEQDSEVKKDTQVAVNDCMIEGQELPGKGSKKASDVIERWNNNFKSNYTPRLQAILNPTVSPLPSATVNAAAIIRRMWVRVMVALINCVEAQIEPSIKCFDENKEPCKKRRRVPTMVKKCIRTDSTG